MIDVACGSGGLAVEAARRRMHVLANDAAPAMVDRAAERLRPFEVCQAQATSFDALAAETSTFDIATSFFGTLLFPEWFNGLRELARVLRSGGKAALTTWTEDRDASPGLSFKRAFDACFPNRRFWPYDFFPHQSAGSLMTAMQDVGFADVKAC